MNEKALLFSMLRSAMAETEASTPRATGIIAWCRSNADYLGLAKFACKLERSDAAKDTAAKKKAARRKRRVDPWRLLERALVDAEAAAKAGSAPKPAAILVVAERLSKMLNLTAEETRLLQIVVAIKRLRWVASLHWRLHSHGMDSATFAAKLAGFETVETLRLSAAVQLDLVTLSLKNGGAVSVDLGDAVNRVLSSAPVTDDDLIESLVGASAPAKLSLADFPELAQPTGLLHRLLAGALAQRAEGVNILLYGPPGTGKTELAKALAKAAGARLYAVGETDDYGDEPTRWERVTALTLAQKILAVRRDCLLLFDEMEDLIGEAERGHDNIFVKRSGSKVFINRLFENNAVPTIWTTNAIANIDPAYLRRMSYVLKMDVPRPAARKRILNRILADEGMPLAEADVETLAASAPEVTTVARKAIRSANLAAGGGKEVRQAVTSLVTGMRHGDPVAPSTSAARPLDLSLYRADRSIEALFARLTDQSVPRNFSLLMTGPPGTGKTALAHNLACGLNQPLIIRRASDLLSKWVGDSEKRIARAFAEAAETGSVLLFDEIDSLIFDRSAATRSWEVSQVNELLTWMDDHPEPFIAATNHADRLDPAAMRRFVFKIRLKPLSAAQAARAFRSFFGMTAPAGLGEIEGLTPGDFAVVARQLAFDLERPTPPQLVGLLAAEGAAKGRQRRRIGFHPPGPPPVPPTLEKDSKRTLPRPLD